MRKSNTQSIGSVLKSYVRENNLERKMNELDLIKSWESVMGKTVSRYTGNLYIQNNILRTFKYLSKPPRQSFGMNY